MSRSVAFNILNSSPTAKLSPSLSARLSQRPPTATLRGIIIKLISAAERREEILFDKQVRSSMSRSYFHPKAEMEVRERRAFLMKRCKAYLKHQDAESRYSRIMGIKTYVLNSQNHHKDLVAEQAQEAKEQNLHALDVRSTFKIIHAGIRRDAILLRKSLRAGDHVEESKFQGRLAREFRNLQRLSVKCKSARKQRRAQLNRMNSH